MVDFAQYLRSGFRKIGGASHFSAHSLESPANINQIIKC